MNAINERENFNNHNSKRANTETLETLVQFHFQGAEGRRLLNAFAFNIEYRFH